MGFALIPDQVFLGRRLELGVASDLDLSIVQTNRAEILRKTFVEPSLRRWIVEVQQPESEVAGDRSPRLLLEQIENDEILVVAREQESWSVDGLPLMQGRELVIRLVALEGQDGERARIVDAVFAEEIGENGTHLFKAKGNFAAFLLAGVGDNGEMSGVNLEPGGLGGGTGAKAKRCKQDQQPKRDGTGTEHWGGREVG